jgi:hypothetical protein
MTSFAAAQASPNGANHASPGQRPGLENQKKIQALTGRPKPCRSPLPASTSISSSAPRTANPSSPIEWRVGSMANVRGVLDRAGCAAPSGLGPFVDATPRAMPWAGMGRRVAAGGTAA